MYTLYIHVDVCTCTCIYIYIKQEHTRNMEFITDCIHKFHSGTLKRKKHKTHISISSIMHTFICNYVLYYMYISGREISLQHLVSNSVTSAHHSTTSMHCHVKMWCSLS